MPVKLTDQNFNEEVILESEKLVLVDFWAEWCNPCRMLSPIIEAMETKFKDTYKICKLNTDESSDTAQKYEITGIPCCIVFKNGKEIERIIGYRTEDAFSEELKKILDQ